MAYNNRNAAYDLSLFDDEPKTNLAPKRRVDDEPVRKVKKKKKNNILTFSEKEVNKARRRRHNPFKLIFGTLAAGVVVFVIGAIIVGQVQLTELNQEIISAQSKIADTQSVYTQNQMKLEGTLSNAQIEKYATEVLGMTKASNAQKEFVTLEGEDRAEVSMQKSDNIFTRFVESIKNLWS